MEIEKFHVYSAINLLTKDEIDIVPVKEDRQNLRRFARNSKSVFGDILLKCLFDIAENKCPELISEAYGLALAKMSVHPKYGADKIAKIKQENLWQS